MVPVMVNDLDYLAARLHGRRSRMAEAARLEGLCRCSSLAELGSAILPEAEVHGAAEFQRRLVGDLVSELSSFLRHLDGAGADLLSWMLVRFQVENVKVLLRACLNRIPVGSLREHLVSLPPSLAINTHALAGAGSFEDFVNLLPLGEPRSSLREAIGTDPDSPRLFLLEAALDRGYLQELLSRAERLSGEDRELIRPVVLQEADTFHLMLAVRGKFHHGLPTEQLLPLHVLWSRIPAECFGAMLGAPDISAAAEFAVGRAIDALPGERGSSEAAAGVGAADLEVLAWKRFLRLSNRAFRWSHMGLGTIVGYACLRRVEMANLITLSEGIRTGMTAEAIHARLIPRVEPEDAHV